MEISKFQFSEPLLLKTQFEMIPPSEGVEQDHKVTLHFEKSIIRDQEKKPQAIVNFLIQLNKEGECVREKSSFFLEMYYQCKFQWDPSLSEELTNQLLDVNAPSVILSYARPLIASLTNASPLPAYNIPFINMMHIK